MKCGRQGWGGSLERELQTGLSEVSTDRENWSKGFPGLWRSRGGLELSLSEDQYKDLSGL